MNKHRKLALAVLASITIAGIAGASASSLGGITSAGIGSDDAITASCDSNGMSVSYNTVYNSTLGRYDVGTVTFSGVDAACSGKTASLVLSDLSKASLTSVSGAITVASGSFTLDPTDVSAELVEGLSLVIQG